MAADGTARIAQHKLEQLKETSARALLIVLIHILFFRPDHERILVAGGSPVFKLIRVDSTEDLRQILHHISGVAVSRMRLNQCTAINLKSIPG